jgi:hypothetical protein
VSVSRAVVVFAVAGLVVTAGCSGLGLPTTDVSTGSPTTDVSTDSPMPPGSASTTPPPAETTGDSTDTARIDSDGDGLPDAVELRRGTDPENPDTDGDGLTDGIEVTALSEADPLRMDVFVEVDYMNGTKPSTGAIELVREAYASAPVENPDGSTGISLHVHIDDEIAAEERTEWDRLGGLMDDHFDAEDRGYHYGLVVNDVRVNGTDSTGAAASGVENGQFMFETAPAESTNATRITAGVFMHELGHSVGITSEAYRGVDSEAVWYQRYESVMNYDAPAHAVGYNSGPPFDDWAFIAENLYTPEVAVSPGNDSVVGD